MTRGLCRCHGITTGLKLSTPTEELRGDESVKCPSSETKFGCFDCGKCLKYLAVIGNEMSVCFSLVIDKNLGEPVDRVKIYG